VGYILQLNQARYYVTGDTQPLPEMAQIRADVLFLCSLDAAATSSRPLESPTHPRPGSSCRSTPVATRSNQEVHCPVARGSPGGLLHGWQARHTLTIQRGVSHPASGRRQGRNAEERERRAVTGRL